MSPWMRRRLKRSIIVFNSCARSQLNNAERKTGLLRKVMKSRMVRCGTFVNSRNEW